MTRRAARITHDEVARMVKAVQATGLSIGNVRFDGELLDIVINSKDSGETSPAPAVHEPPKLKLIREPKL